MQRKGTPVIRAQLNYPANETYYRFRKVIEIPFSGCQNTRIPPKMDCFPKFIHTKVDNTGII